MCVTKTGMLIQIEWKGANGWNNPLKYRQGLWQNKGTTTAGYAKRFRNLDFLIAYNSGHLVPFNQPSHVLDLVTRFLWNETFIDVQQKTLLYPQETATSMEMLGLAKTKSSLLEPSSGQIRQPQQQQDDDYGAQEQLLIFKRHHHHNEEEDAAISNIF